jgi:hypothetical protein
MLCPVVDLTIISIAYKEYNLHFFAEPVGQEGAEAASPPARANQVKVVASCQRRLF